MPYLDGRQDGKLISHSYSNHFTHIQFLRKINTGDMNDVPLDTAAFLLWAVGPSPIHSDGTFSMHDGHGVVGVFFTEPSEMIVVEEVEPAYRDETLIKAHANCMVIAWVFFSVLSVVSSRYLKETLEKVWFPAHFFLNVGMLLFLLIGFFCAVGSVNSYNGHHIYSPHEILGVSVFVAAFVNAFLGIFSRFVWDPQKPIPVFPTQCHWWFGRVVIAFALSNIALGLEQLRVGVAAWVFYALYIFALMVLFFFFELQKRKDEEEQWDEAGKAGEVMPYAPSAMSQAKRRVLSLITVATCTILGFCLVISIGVD